MWALSQLLSCYPRPRLINKVLDRVAQAVVRGGARCASQLRGRGTQADARGATHVHDCGAGRFPRRRSLCVAYSWSWCQDRFLQPQLRGVVDAAFMPRLKRAATMSQQEGSIISVVQRNRANISLSVQVTLALAAIYFSRVEVVGSVFAAALRRFTFRKLGSLAVPSRRR